MNTSHVESHIGHVQMCKTLLVQQSITTITVAASSFVYAFLTHGRKNVSVVVKIRALSSSSVSRPQILNMSGSSIMTSNLPPELLERINKAQNKVNRHSTYNFETSSGGFIPYHSMTRRATSLGATALSTNADVAQITEASHWLTRNQVRLAALVMARHDCAARLPFCLEKKKLQKRFTPSALCFRCLTKDLKKIRVQKKRNIGICLNA